MSARALRQKYTRSFVGLDKHARATAWAIVIGYFIQIAASVGLGAYLLSIPVTGLTMTIGVLLMLFIGTRLRGLNNIVHECSHATFSSHRGDNALIGKICASFTLNSFEDYRDEHLSHHKHLGDYEHDMDLQGIQNLSIHDPLTPSVVLRHIAVPILGRHLPYYLGMNMSSRDGFGFQAMKYGLLAAAVAFTFAFPMTGLLFVIVPFMFFYSALNYWADCLDHAGIVASDEELEASRNINAPKLVRWLFFPRNDCFHLVHHLFPHIPARHLETSHYTLAEEEVYRSRPNAVRGGGDREPVSGGATFPAE